MRVRALIQPVAAALAVVVAAALLQWGGRGAGVVWRAVPAAAGGRVDALAWGAHRWWIGTGPTPGTAPGVLLSWNPGQGQLLFHVPIPAAGNVGIGPLAVASGLLYYGQSAGLGVFDVRRDGFPAFGRDLNVPAKGSALRGLFDWHGQIWFAQEHSYNPLHHAQNGPAVLGEIQGGRVLAEAAVPSMLGDRLGPLAAGGRRLWFYARSKAKGAFRVVGYSPQAGSFWISPLVRGISPRGLAFFSGRLWVAGLQRGQAVLLTAAPGGRRATETLLPGTLSSDAAMALVAEQRALSLAIADGQHSLVLWRRGSAARAPWRRTDLMEATGPVTVRGVVLAPGPQGSLGVATGQRWVLLRRGALAFRPYAAPHRRVRWSGRWSQVAQNSSALPALLVLHVRMAPGASVTALAQGGFPYGMSLPVLGPTVSMLLPPSTYLVTGRDAHGRTKWLEQVVLPGGSQSTLSPVPSS